MARKVYMSELLSTYNQQRAFDKWVDEQCDSLRASALESRDYIIKSELAHELALFTTLKKAYAPVKRLRKSSPSVDIMIATDKSGYHQFRLILPLTREDISRVMSVRSERVASLGRDGSVCVHSAEVIWDVLGDTLRSSYPFAELNGMAVTYHDWTLSVGVTRFK